MKYRHLLFSYPGSLDIEKAFFDPNARDNCHEPFILLRDECRELGYLIEAVGRQSIRDTAWLMFWNSSSFLSWTGPKGFLRRMRHGFPGRARNWLAKARRAGITDRLALFLWEPPSVCPENQDASIHSQFTVVFSWNDDLVDGVHVHKLYLPIPVRVPQVERVNFSRKKLLVNISTNKVSHYPHELYSARRDAIRYFERSRPEDFDLYGVGWDGLSADVTGRFRPPTSNRTAVFYRSYRGVVEHKWDVFPRYRFALCYENVCDQPGLITEKIFDCMRADCVPVYLGAPNVTEYIDPAAFIDRRRFNSDRELEDYISGVNAEQYERFREAAATYLASERFKCFLAPAFAQQVIRVLGLDRVS